jgi:hypothetical protein
MEPAFSRFVHVQALISICAGRAHNTRQGGMLREGWRPPAIRNRRLGKLQTRSKRVVMEPAFSRFDLVQALISICAGQAHITRLAGHDA